MSEMKLGQAQFVASLFPQAIAPISPQGPGAAVPKRSSTALHIAGIRALAEEVGRPFDEVAGLYQCELVRLGSAATVTAFLPILVVKRVRLLYKHRLYALQRDDPCAALLPPAGTS